MSAARMLKRAGSATSSVRNTVSRSFHETERRPAILMPAMSPFMMEGTITKWVKQEGESFETGDVLLQIESDIAVIDVQATHPGIIGKILTPEGATHVPVSKVIALVARTKEELDKLWLATPPSSPLTKTPSSSSTSRTPIGTATVPRTSTPTPHTLNTIVHRNLRNASFMSAPPPISPSTTTTTPLHTIAGLDGVMRHSNNAVSPTPAPPSPIHSHARSVSFAFGSRPSLESSSEYARAGLDIRKQVVANMRRKAVKDCFDEIL